MMENRKRYSAFFSLYIMIIAASGVKHAYFLKCILILQVCIAGGAGFIGSHIAMRLKAEGWYVIAADWKVNEFMQPAEFCHVFAHCDLRQRDNCVAVSEGCEQCYNMAADMGGMGFIVSNQSGDTFILYVTMLNKVPCTSMQAMHQQQQWHVCITLVYCSIPPIAVELSMPCILAQS
jgi:NAD dependent epimerase/dehydratase family